MAVRATEKSLHVHQKISTALSILCVRIEFKLQVVIFENMKWNTVEPLYKGHLGTSKYCPYNREVSTSQRVIIHRKYREIVIWVTKTCPLYGDFLYCVLNTECPLSEVPLYKYHYSRLLWLKSLVKLRLHGCMFTAGLCMLHKEELNRYMVDS